MNADADLVVTSVHKMGGAIEQSSVFHLQHDRVSPTVLKQREDLLGTTSASCLVYAALDGWRRQMVEQGHGLLDAALHRAERIRARLRELPGLRVMGGEVIEMGLAAEFDPLKIVVDVRDLGISGMQAAEWLRANCHIDVGGSDTCRISASITHSDDDETEKLLVESVRSLVERAETWSGGPPCICPEPSALELEQAVLPREAFFAAAEQVPAEQAVGRIAAEMISPYPPGVPVVAPGEVITAEIVDYLRSGVAHGFLLPDAADSLRGDAAGHGTALTGRPRPTCAGRGQRLGVAYAGGGRVHACPGSKAGPAAGTRPRQGALGPAGGPRVRTSASGGPPAPATR